MRAIVQRVREACVTVDGRSVGRIDRGILVLVGVETGDTPADVAWLAGKIARLRIFPDDAGRMNRDLTEAGGAALVVSQFTLLADVRRGNRPSFVQAAGPEEAIPLYEAFLGELSAAVGRPVARGVFGADMLVSLVNDGPVTIPLDSRHRTAGCPPAAGAD